MTTWDLKFQTVVYRSLHDLRTSVPSHYVFCVLLLIIFVIVMSYFHFKIYQKKSTKQFPIFPWFTYLRAMIVGRKRATASFLELVCGVCRLYPKEGMYGIFFGPVKYLFLYSPNAIEFALKSRVSLDKGSEYYFIRPLTKNSVFMCPADKWRLRRKQLTPAFHFRNTDHFTDVFNKQARILVDNIDELMEKEGRVEIFEVTGLATFDTILETSVGTKVSYVEKKRKAVLKATHAAAGIISKRIALPWYWIDLIFWRTAEGKILRKSADSVDNFVRELIQDRKCDAIRRLRDDKSEIVTEHNHDESGSPKNLFLTDILMNMHLKENSVSFDEMVEEVQTFILAAHDTTAIAMSWTLFLLGHHQDIQREIHKEIDKLLGDDIDRTITTEDCKSLKFLNCAFKESIRLCPPGGIMSRNLVEDAVINGYAVPKGTSLVILTDVLHKNPEFFPNPEKFIPDRFSEENDIKRHPYCYIPFSAGPRNCIGQRYAKNSAITFLATVLRHFSVESLEHRDKVHVAFEVTTVPESGIYLKFTRRKFLKKSSCQR